MKKRVVCLAMAAVLAMASLSGCSKGSSNGLPKNIEVQVPAKAGGGTDVMARTLATQVAKDSGSNVTIVNNTDGGGVVAMETVRTAKGDASKILQFHTSMLIKTATGVYDKSAAEDFKIWGVSQGKEKAQYVLVTAASSGVDTLDKFLEKGKTEEIKLGVETGGTSHIISGLLVKATGINVKYVEAGSDTEKLTALVGNTIDAALVNVNQAKQYVESDKAYALAVVSNGEEGVRSTVLPDVPSFKEQGVDCTFAMVNLFCGPKDMSEETAKKLYDLYSAAAQSADVNATLEPAGMAMDFMGYEDGPKFVADMQTQINATVEALGLKK